MELKIDDIGEDAISDNIIKVIGIGGAGNNAVNHMYKKSVEGIDYVVCNTDIQDLQHSPVPYKLQIGVKLTEGLGAGSVPASGKDAAEESEQEIAKMLSGKTRMVIITAGMGGGTGTGASPVVARIAKDMGMVVVCIVTTPFGFERQRIKEAISGIKELNEVSDALLAINNKNLQRIYGDLSFPEACEKANDVLVIAAKSISEIVTHTASQNIDYADLERMLKGSGVALFGVGSARGGADRVKEAIKEALYSPLLDNCDIRGAQSLLVNIVLGEDSLSVGERKKIGEYMQNAAGHYKEMKFGKRIDNELQADEIVVTIIATNFNIDNSFQYIENKDLIYDDEYVDSEIDIKMIVEDTRKTQEDARKKELNRQKNQKRRKKAQEEARCRTTHISTSNVADPVEKYKKSKTRTNNKNKASDTLQNVLGFFLGEDLKDTPMD